MTGLNIKNDEAFRLVHELSELTGESLTKAVTEAVRERLERLRSEKEPQTLAARLMEIGRRTAPRIREPWKSVGHGDLLYDEQGLPR